MNKTFVLASLIVAIVLALAYCELLPSFISVTVSICVFVLAGCNFVKSASRDSFTEIRESHERNNTNIIKAFDVLYERLVVLSRTIENNNSSVLSDLENLSSLMVKYQTVFDSMTNKFVQSITDLSSNVCKKLNSIDRTNELYFNELKINSLEISKLHTSLTSLNKEISSSSAKLMTTAEFHYDKLGTSIVSVTRDLEKRIEYIVTSLSSLNDSIEKYTVSSEAVKDSHCSLSKEISDGIKSLKDVESSLSRGNKHLIEDLKDLFSDKMENLLKGIENVNIAQTESLSESEIKIRQSIDKLCNNLSSNLQKLGIDIEIICESIEDMKKMSQYVEQADKNLLSQISKLCKK